MTRYERALEAMERALFAEVLTECNGNHVHAAKALGVSRGMFCSRLVAYGMHTPKPRAEPKPKYPERPIPSGWGAGRSP